jgi:hypothetical protein
VCVNSRVLVAQCKVDVSINKNLLTEEDIEVMQVVKSIGTSANTPSLTRDNSPSGTDYVAA